MQGSLFTEAAEGTRLVGTTAHDCDCIVRILCLRGRPRILASSPTPILSVKSVSRVRVLVLAQRQPRYLLLPRRRRSELRRRQVEKGGPEEG